MNLAHLHLLGPKMLQFDNVTDMCEFVKKKVQFLNHVGMHNTILLQLLSSKDYTGSVKGCSNSIDFKEQTVFFFCE